MPVEVTPQETGTFDIFARATLSGGETTYTDPSIAGTEDQQEYPVEHHEVDVVTDDDIETQANAIDHLLVGLEHDRFRR